MTIDFTKLPAGLPNYFFSFFTKPEIYEHQLVSRFWKKMVNDKCAEIIKKIFRGSLPPTKNYIQFLQELDFHYLKSNEAIIERLQRFLCKVSLGFNARFRCSFNNPKAFLISVEIKATEDKIPTPLNLPPTYGAVYENSVTKYGYEEHFVAENSISEGACSIPSPIPFTGKFHYAIKLDSFVEYTTVFRPKKNDCIQAVLRFPKLSDTSTPLERRITYIVLRKCEQLSLQFATQEYPLITPSVELVISTELAYG